MRVLVTGGAGYVGSTLVPMLLGVGHEVRVLDSMLHGGDPLLGVWTHPGFELRAGDIRDSDLMRDAVRGTDAVVHLAAIVGDPACARDPEGARSVNLEASLQLLDACRTAGVARFVFTSTCSNYGRMADPESYVDERSPLAPVSLYAETKVAVERCVMVRSSLCATALRLATVFGVSPRMRFDLTINEFAAQLVLEGQLDVYGPQFWRPYVHVRDVARAVLAVLSAPPEQVAGEVFNVGATTENYRKRDLVALIQPYAPDAVVDYVAKAEDPRDYRVSFTKIQQRLAYDVTRRVPEGIGEIVHLVRSGAIRDIHDPRYRN